jgi:hypothetical protein
MIEYLLPVTGDVLIQKVVAPVILCPLTLDILGATSEAGTTYPFEPHEFTLIFFSGVDIYSILSLMCNIL